MLGPIRTTIVMGAVLSLAGGCAREMRCTAVDCSDGPVDGGDASQDTSDGSQPPADAGVTLGARLAPAGPNEGWFRAVAATRDAVFVGTATGVHRSRDGGETWTMLPVRQLAQVRAMVALGSEVFVSALGGVLRSTDGGETWAHASHSVDHLAVDGSTVFMTNSGSVSRWNAAASRWDPLPRAPLPIDVVGSDGARLYGSFSSRGGVYRLDLAAPDAGWTQVGDLENTWGYRAFAFVGAGAEGFTSNSREVFHREDGAWARLAGQLSSVTHLLVAGGVVYAAASDGVYTSVDRGETWTRATSGMQTTRYALASDGASVYAASRALWRRRGDAGAWERLTLPAHSVRALAAVDDAVLSFSDVGVHRRDAGGWTRVEIGSGRTPPFDPFQHTPDRGWDPPVAVHDGEVFAPDSDGTLWASRDGGRTFNSRAALGGQFVPFLTSTARGLVMGIDTHEWTTLRRSRDGGRNWVDLPRVTGGRVGCQRLTEAQGTLFLTCDLVEATTTGATFRSLDQGETWLQIPSGDVGLLGALAATPDALFAASSAGGVVRSTDRGATWQRVGLAALPVSAVVARGGVVFVGVGSHSSFDGGVYYSSDQGATWAALDPAFTERVGALAFQGESLVVGTLDHATWSGLIERTPPR